MTLPEFLLQGLGFSSLLDLSIEMESTGTAHD